MRIGKWVLLELRELEYTAHQDAKNDRLRDLAIIENQKRILANQVIIQEGNKTLNENLIGIGRILFARDDNIDAALRNIAALLEAIAPGKAASLNLTMSLPEDNE